MSTGQPKRSDMPAISTSGTRGGSPRAGPSVPRDNNQNGGATDRDLEDDSGNGAENSWGICPTSKDEPTLFCRLSGNTMSGFTEVCGWSLLNPLKFNNIHVSTKFKQMSDSRGSMVKAAYDLKSKCITLAEMKDMIGYPGQVNHPVFVQVVAKKKVSVLHCSNKLLVIPLVVVADVSGYCVVCSFNEGMGTVHKSVDVGDLLLITSSVPQRCKIVYHKGLFSENMFLDLELKIQYYSVRNHYLRKFTARQLPDFKLQPALFDESCRLKIPSDLEKEFQNTEQPPWVTPPDAEQFYDLIGVISYVSRIERFRMRETDVECLVNSEIKLQQFNTYVTFRWIQLLDKKSKPFPVKLYNLALDCQDILVPGAIIIITHCQSTKTDFSTPHSTTSYFSEIYSGPQIETYYMLHPSSFFTEGPRELYARSNYVEIMSRTDCHWSIGGMPTMKIHSEERFREWYFTNVNPNDIELQNISRRESHRLCFTGLILRAFTVQEDDCPSIYYVHERFKEFKQLKSAKYKLSEHPLPYDMFNNVSWYSFMRRLPPINQEAFQLPKCRDIVKKIVESFESYCGPLLMPAKIDDHNLPLMADLERVDGPPYFLLDIFNETTCHWYRCIWKSCHYTIDEMTEKVNLAKQKQIKCLAEQFCLEKYATLEVNLHDFVIDDVE